MKTFRNKEWANHLKEVSYELQESANVDLLANSTGHILAIGTAPDGTDFILASAMYSIRLKSHLAGFKKLTLTAKAPFSVRNLVYLAQVDEPRHDKPPIPPEPASNPLKAMRDKFRAEMGVTREAFEVLMSADRPGYELDDDDPGMFEEELASSRSQPAAAPSTPSQTDSEASTPRKDEAPATTVPADE